MNATETCRIVVAIHTTGIAAYRAADSRDSEPYAPIVHRRAIKMDADAGNGPDKPDTPPEKRKKLPVYNGNAIGVDLCEDKLVYDSQFMRDFITCNNKASSQRIHHPHHRNTQHV